MGILLGMWGTVRLSRGWGRIRLAQKHGPRTLSPSNPCFGQDHAFAMLRCLVWMGIWTQVARWRFDSPAEKKLPT